MTMEYFFNQIPQTTMNLEDILKLEDNSRKIELLKQRRTPHPNVSVLMEDWDPDRHEVTDTEKRPKRRVLKKEAYEDEKGSHPAEYDYEDVNRITLPIEQDIVNIHTAFTIGTEPKLICEPNNDDERKLLTSVKAVTKRNKLKYHNKRVVRSWLSETEVAEYWYTVKGGSFWKRVMASSTDGSIGVLPDTELKCTIWSPFRGDKLYPLYDDTGNLIAFSREFEVHHDALTTHTYFQTVTDTMVYQWQLGVQGWKLDSDRTFTHNFPKMPIIYAERRRTLCHNIRTMRNRLEKLLSNYADCIDYHFFPYLILEGNRVKGGVSGSSKGKMIKLEKDAKAYYLTWDQVPDAIKLEIDTLLEQCYAMTNTARISFENLKGIGNALSGTAFEFTFMGSHMAVENHAEVIGEFLQRRINFLVSALGSINPHLRSAVETIDIEPEIVPYMIDFLADKIKMAVEATGKPIASLKTGIALAGIVDKVEEEAAQIDEPTAS